MKKLLFATVALMMIICSCNKEEGYLSVTGSDVINAVISVDDETRTTMNVNQVVWESSDCISVFSTNGSSFYNNKYTLRSGANEPTADFTGSFVGEKMVAMYPYTQYNVYTLEGISYTLPSSYTYAEGSNNKACVNCSVNACFIIAI